jgi:ankyrin repeat protein
VNIPDYYGATALHRNATRDVAEALIAAGADVNTISYEDNHSMAPIHSAIAHGNRPLVEVLLKHGANVNLKYGPEQRTPLLMGLHGDNLVVPEFIQFLVENGADPNITDRRGRNADWYIQQLNPELRVRFRAAVAEGLRRRALRPIGRNLQSMYLGLGTNALPAYAMEKVMQSLTGVRTKNVAQRNATTGRIRNIGNVRETLRNLKRNYNRV